MGCLKFGSNKRKIIPVVQRTKKSHLRNISCVKQNMKRVRANVSWFLNVQQWKPYCPPLYVCVVCLSVPEWTCVWSNPINLPHRKPFRPQISAWTSQTTSAVRLWRALRSGRSILAKIVEHRSEGDSTHPRRLCKEANKLFPRTSCSLEL